MPFEVLADTARRRAPQAPERRPTAQGINTKLFEMHNKLQVGI